MNDIVVIEKNTTSVIEITEKEIVVIEKNIKLVETGGVGGEAVWGGITGNINTQTDLINKFDTKVDKIEGKGLSTEDYTTGEKTKVGKIIISDSGNKYLSDDGTYKTVSGGEGVDYLEQKITNSNFGNQTFTELKEGNVTRNIKTFKTFSSKKRIMFVGSSVCDGIGASPKSLGWANLLIAELTAKGHTCFNNSIGGNATQNVIDRLDNDVINFKPDVVVISLNINNEGISFLNASEQFEKNIMLITQYLEQNGIEYLIMSSYPSSLHSLDTYKDLKRFNSDLIDIYRSRYINCLGSLDAGNGKWLEGTFADGAHPNNNGHLLMRNSINSEKLSNFYLNESIKSNEKTFYLQSATETSLLPYRITKSTLQTSDNLKDFSIYMEIKKNNLVISGFPKYLFCIRNSDASIYMSLGVSSTGYYVLCDKTGTTLATSTKLMSENLERVCLTHNSFTKTYSVYVDEVLVLTYVLNTDIEFVETIIVGGGHSANSRNLNGAQFRNIAIYRNVLMDYDLRKIKRDGILNVFNLEYFDPCTKDLVDFRNFKNPANTAYVLSAISQNYTLV